MVRNIVRIVNAYKQAKKRTLTSSKLPVTQQTPRIGMLTLCVRDGQLVKQFGAN